MELTLIVPTFNEQDNVGPLVHRLLEMMPPIDWEVVFVDDDSQDKTVEQLMLLAQRHRQVRLIRRIGRRGLASACIEGMLSSSAEFLAVMDADLQHDEKLLPSMLALLKEGSCDLVVGSRYVRGGDVQDWDTRRQWISLMATRLSQRFLPTQIQDPMSGFFMINRAAFEAACPRLSGIGFKILLDLIVSSKKTLRMVELPFHFAPRLNGESKLDVRNAWELLLLMADKAFGRWVPVKLISFAAVGGIGVLVHLFWLTAIFSWTPWPFGHAQAIAAGLTMVFNFGVNNVLTYRDQRLSGLRWWTGLLKFGLACSLGLMANVGVASVLYQGQSGWLLSALAGILIGVVWNYAATSVMVWPNKTKSHGV